MEIVIKIPDEEYNTRQLVHYFGCYSDKLDLVIYNGTPLPKHHGRLIDVNVLKNNIHYVPLAPILQGDYVTYRSVIFADVLDMIPTIIEGSDSE